jgi:hypothetical protein
MASDKAIATALGMLAEAFPTREITKRTATVWKAILSDITDEQLQRAVVKLCRDPERKFFPSSGEVFAAIAAESQPIDVTTVMHRIEKLGYYDPRRGWVYPTIDMIREKLGDAIANAYSVSGGDKVYAPEANDGTAVARDIALRNFANELDRIRRESPAQLMLPAPAPLPALEREAPTERQPLMLKAGQKTPLKEAVENATANVTAEEAA